jgi:hypothetical protein
MKLCLPPGTVSYITHIFLKDSTVTTGAGKTGLIESNITAYYVRAGSTLTLLNMETIATLGTWGNTGNNWLSFREVNSTNAAGLYEIDLPNNILATGTNKVTIYIKGTGAMPLVVEIQLLAVPADIYKVLGTDVTASIPEVNVTEWDGTAVETPTTAGCPAVTLQVDELTNVIESLLEYDFSVITGEASRSMLNALRRLVNKVDIVSNTLTVYKEDDETAALTQTITTSTRIGAISSADTT